MKADDLSTNPRVARLAGLTRALRQSRSAAETLRTIRQTMMDLYGPNASLMLNTRGLADGEYRVADMQLPGMDTGESDPWAKGDSAVYRGGLLATIIQTPEPRLFQEVDWSADPNWDNLLAGYDSVAAIPFTSDRLPVTWLILLQRSPDRITGDDLEQSLLRVTLVSSLLESQTLIEEVADAHAATDAEVRRVGQIQRSLLPHPLPEIPNLQIAASYETSTDAGGDLYDLLPLCSRGSVPGITPWAIFIGDASGHGPSAAVVIAIVQALLHAHPPGTTSPAALLKHLNDHLCERLIESSFVTAFLAVFDPSCNRLHYASAGHPPPLLIHPPSPRPRRLCPATNYPLGIEAHQSFQDECILLHPSDTLLLYTDGITESRNPRGDFFGAEALESALHPCAETPAQLIANVRKSLAAHENGRPLTDDQTIVAIRVA
jgi:phosphoserine phosphatase RsbU/P